MILSGKPLAQTIRDTLAREIEKLPRRPKLAVILVGKNPASVSYVGQKRKACEEVGMDFELFELPEDATEEILVATIQNRNADDGIDGIIVQFPLPVGMNRDRIIDTIDPKKDVDGFTHQSVANVFYGREGFLPCTPKGIMRLLKSFGTSISGKNAVVIGNGNIVGKPLSLLLGNAGATVTICHSKTLDLTAHSRNADIIIVAVGKPGLLKAEMVKPGAIVIDVGVNRQENGQLVGDAETLAISGKADITSVPGGVGPMTVAMLLENTYAAYVGRKLP